MQRMNDLDIEVDLEEQRYLKKMPNLRVTGDSDYYDEGPDSHRKGAGLKLN